MMDLGKVFLPARSDIVSQRLSERGCTSPSSVVIVLVGLVVFPVCLEGVGSPPDLQDWRGCSRMGVLFIYPIQAQVIRKE